MAISEAFQALPGDFFTYVLPFLLVFAIVFGLVQAIGVFGEKNKPVGAILGFVFAMYFLRAGQLGNIAELFTEGSRSFTLLLLLGLVLMMALAMGGIDNGKLFGYPVIAILLLLGALWLLLGTGLLDTVGLGAISVGLGGMNTGTIASLLIGLLLLGWLIWNGED